MTIRSDIKFSILVVTDRQGRLLAYEGNQFHLHSLSEHSFNKIYFDLEIYLVHQIKEEHKNLT